MTLYYVDLDIDLYYYSSINNDKFFPASRRRPNYSSYISSPPRKIIY